MRHAFEGVAISGTVVIGEGEMDEAPMLFIGETVGLFAAGGRPEVDIAVDPPEGTIITVKGGPNAMACVALAQRGGFLHAPEPPADSSVICARQTCFWGPFRLDTNASRRVRSAGVRLSVTPVHKVQARMRRCRQESPNGLVRQAASTRPRR